MEITKKINPELLIENITSYTTQIEEILEQIEKRNTIKSFDIAITPPGPHYYTGVLQASSYFLYQHKSAKKKLALIFSQNFKKKEILLSNEKIGPFLGYTREKSPQIGILTEKYNNIKNIKPTNKMKQKILEQLPFIRIISKTTEILPIFVGNEVTSTKIIPIIEQIQKTHTIFFISKLHESLPEDKCMTEDQNLVNQIFNKKITAPYTKQFPLINIFTKICKKNNKTPKNIAYLNSGNFGGDMENTTGYTNIVA